MAYSLYDAAVTPCAQQLGALAGIIDKAAAHCAANKIEEYWRLGCKVLNLPGNDVSTYLDGMKARAGRAHARLKSIGVPVP